MAKTCTPARGAPLQLAPSTQVIGQETAPSASTIAFSVASRAANDP